MNRAYKLRTFLIFSFFIFLYFTIFFNLYLIQIINSTYFSDLAKKQYNISVTINPPRATIFDSKNNPVALNKESLSAFILPNKLQESEKVKKFLKKYFPQAHDRLNNYKNKFFMHIKRRLTEEQINLIKESNLEDIKILKEPSRFYPNESVAIVTGVTNIDNKGMFGIEYEFNDQLSGSPTSMVLEKDARSGHFYFKKEITKTGIDSKSINLTIDSELQFLAQEELQETMAEFEAKEGAVVILNPDNGHILTMTSLPGFDPNNYENLNLENTKNKAISNTYEFGSVMKVFVAIAALQEGVVKIDELIDCENTKETQIDGFSFSTTIAQGIVPFAEVVEKSNNIGMAKVSKKLGTKIYDHYLNFGFGKKTNIPLNGENKGYVNPPDKWSRRSFISLSFGYEITANLLQLATAFSIIANDGYQVRPKLIISENDQKENPKQIYSPEVIQQIKQILQNTVNQGTAKRAAVKGYKVMGKTGTGNLAIDGSYSKTKNIYSFLGIIEKDDYKRIIAIYIKETPRGGKDLFGSAVAAPLFEKIAEKLLIHDKIIK